MLRNLFLFAAFVLPAAPLFSGTLSVVLNPSVQAGAAGGSVIFSGTLTNVGPGDLLLNNMSFVFTPPAGTYLSANLGPHFFTDVPGVLFEDEVYNGPIFDILIAAGTPSGTYFGSAIFLGGPGDGDPFAEDPLNTSPVGDFTVVVVPEPQTVGLMLAGLVALAFIRRRARAS